MYSSVCLKVRSTTLGVVKNRYVGNLAIPAEPKNGTAVPVFSPKYQVFFYRFHDFNFLLVRNSHFGNVILSVFQCFNVLFLRGTILLAEFFWSGIRVLFLRVVEVLMAMVEVMVMMEK